MESETPSNNKLEILYAKYCASREQQWQCFMTEARKEITEIQKKAKQLEQDQLMFAKMAKDGDEILSINVSGEKFCVRRSVLTMVQDSELQKMFENEDKLMKDKEGNYYFDFNAFCFRRIVDFMKMKHVQINDDSAPLPVIDQNMKQEFEFWGSLSYFRMDKKS